MTSSPSPAPLAYEETTAPHYSTQAAATFEIRRLGHGMLLLSGPCPRCSEDMEMPVVDTVVRVLGRGVGRLLARQPQTQEIPVICTCETDHPGRPAEHEGCGAYWLLVIPAGLT